MKLFKYIFSPILMTVAFVVVIISAGCAQQKSNSLPSGSASDSTTVNSSPYPLNVSDLDRYLEIGDYSSLNTATMQANDVNAVYKNMNWEKDRLRSGASSFVAIMYARDIWRLINAKNVGINSVTSHEFLKTALMSMFYAYELTYLDGVKCEDVTAPERRRANLFSKIPGVDLAEIWKSFSSLSGDDQKQILLNAIKIEADTAPLRGDDKFLCSGGDAAIKSANLSAATQSYLNSHDGQITGNVQIPIVPASNYQPKFVSKDVWKPEQEHLREPSILQGKILVELIKKIRN